MKKISFLAYWWTNTWRFLVFCIIFLGVAFLCEWFSLGKWEPGSTLTIAGYTLGINLIILLGTISEYRKL